MNCGRGNLRQEESGVVFLEVLIVLTVMGIFAAFALPRGASFLRMAAVEYETEHLLSDVKWVQSRTRTYGYLTSDISSVPHPENGWLRLLIKSNVYEIMNPKGAERTHKFLPCVRAKVIGRAVGAVSDRDSLEFGINGGVIRGGTIRIFWEGYELYGRDVIVDAAGRIRVQRVDTNGGNLDVEGF